MLEFYLYMPYNVKNLHNKNHKILKNNEIRRSIVSNSYKLYEYRNIMNKMVSNGVITELNKEYISYKKYTLKILLFCLNNQGILPLEVISKIKHYGLELIKPNKDICEIITDDLVKAIIDVYLLDTGYIDTIYEKRKIMLRFDKYKYKKPEYYKFIENVLLYGDIYKYQSRGKTFRRYYGYIWRF